METLVSDMNCEFPVINPNLVGRQHRYVYLACTPVSDLEKFSQKAKESTQFTGFIKYDTEKGHIAKHVDYGGEKMAGEVAFHPRTNSDSEDDG